MKRALLHLQTHYTRLEVPDADVLQALKHSMTVRKGTFVPQSKGASALAPRWGWNGTVSFLSVSQAVRNKVPTAKFPTLLLPHVVNHFKRVRGYELHVESDKRAPVPDWLDASLVDPALLARPLRAYQLQALEDIVRARDGVVKIATGGGKTVIFAALIKLAQLRDPQCRIVVLFRSVALIQQTLEVLRAFEVDGVGCVHAGRMDTAERITLSTVQSIHRLPQSNLDETRIVMADECHLFTSSKSIKALRLFPNVFMRLGFSATPWKDDEHHNWTVRSWLGPEICSISTQTLTETHNVLSKARCTFFKLNRQSLQLWEATFAEGYLGGVVQNERLNARVVELVKQLDGRILILVNRIAHGETLAAMLGGPEGNVYWVSGSDTLEERAMVLQQLRASNAGRCVAILSSIGNTGIDVHLHHLINAAGGLSPNLTIQTIGRGLRKADDKSELCYWDFLNHTNYHMEQHSKARMETLRREGHEIIVK